MRDFRVSCGKQISDIWTTELHLLGTENFKILMHFICVRVRVCMMNLHSLLFPSSGSRTPVLPIKITLNSKFFKTGKYI